MSSNSPPVSAASVSPIEVNLAYLLPICLVATLGGLLFGYDTGVISGAIEPLAVHFNLDEIMKGWASGCVLIGCASGVLMVGPISDRLGRRLALFFSAGLFLISSIGTALPGSIEAFIVFRLLGGLGIGIASMATPLYIAEIAPAHLRGRLVTVNQIAIVGGIAATAFINYYIAGLGNQDWIISTGWRWMFATGIAPATAFLGFLFLIPESPRWLVEAHRLEAAREILSRVSSPAYAESELTSIQTSLESEKGSWTELLSARLRRPLAVGIALAILQQVTGINVFLYFGATIFKTMSASTGVDAGLLEQIVINGSCTIFTLVALVTVDRWGRRPLLLIGATGMGVSLATMGFMVEHSVDLASAGNMMLACIILYIGCFGLSVGPVTWVILSEIFPTTVRGRALGLATFCLWMADYLVTQSFPMMDARSSWFVVHFHHAFPFYLYTGFCVILFVLVLRFIPETKGRSLEDIDKCWSSD